MSSQPKECPLCGGTGWKPVAAATSASGEKKKAPQVGRCDCRTEARADVLLAKARIPARYEKSSVDNFDVGFEGAGLSLKAARSTAQNFVTEYPVSKRGLLFTGTAGLGKTHLAVGIIRELISKKRISCLFSNYRELMKQIQNSYNPEVNATELSILRPVFEADVLVLDELGAVRPTGWAFDTVGLIINSRYNENRATIITTNYPDGEEAPAATDQIHRAARVDTLGDRVGSAMRSRIVEMCKIVKMTGNDYRLRPQSTVALR